MFGRIFLSVSTALAHASDKESKIFAGHRLGARKKQAPMAAVAPVAMAHAALALESKSDAVQDGAREAAPGFRLGAVASSLAMATA
jgi:hypothetical protein